jgi:hypothetical protein
MLGSSARRTVSRIVEPTGRKLDLSESITSKALLFVGVSNCLVSAKCLEKKGRNILVIG